MEVLVQLSRMLHIIYWNIKSEQLCHNKCQTPGRKEHFLSRRVEFLRIFLHLTSFVSPFLSLKSEVTNAWARSKNCEQQKFCLDVKGQYYSG